MKKRIIIFLILILVVIFTANILINKKSKEKDGESGFGSIINAPKIPNIISENPPITFEEEILETFPDKLPTIKQKFSVPLSDEAARNIARNLGFDDEPIIAEDAQNGLVYIWNNYTNSLIITLKLRKIKYAPSKQAIEVIQNTQNKQLSPEDQKIIAKNFVINNFNIDNSNINYISTIYLKLEPGAESFKESVQESADVYRINFSPIFEKIPLITLNPQNYLYSLDILKDGNVLNAEIILPTELSLSEDQHKIKTSSEITSEISEAKIVSINQGNENLHDLVLEDLNNIKIKSTKLAYLYDDVKSINLLPIFILKGDLQISRQRNPTEVVLYMPAIKNP